MADFERIKGTEVREFKSPEDCTAYIDKHFPNRREVHEGIYRLSTGLLTVLRKGTAIRYPVTARRSLVRPRTIMPRR